MAALHRLLDDWGLPQALIQLALVFLVFAAVEYASGDRVLPLGEVSVSLVLGRLLLRLAGAKGNAGTNLILTFPQFKALALL